MKKLAIIVATLLMVTSLAGCGNKIAPESPKSNSESAVQSSSVASQSEANSASTTPTTSVTAERGIWTDTVFHNEFSGMTFTLPEGWVVLSDEEIASTLAIGIEQMGKAGEAFTEEALTQNTLYDLMAVNGATRDNIVVMFENLAVNPIGNFIKEDAYLMSLKSQMNNVDTGIEYTFSEISAVYNKVRNFMKA